MEVRFLECENNDITFKSNVAWCYSRIRLRSVEEGKGKQNIGMTSDAMTTLMMRNLVH